MPFVERDHMIEQILPGNFLPIMSKYSSREAAKKLGISFTSLNRYIADRKIPVPEVERLGGGQFRVWTDQDIERVRSILPKIANGRKTRYKKKQSAKKKSK